MQSGIGFVHNARLIGKPQKYVVRAPFFQFPKPAWSVFHRSSAETLERAARMEAAQSAAKVPGLLSSALWQ